MLEPKNLTPENLCYGQNQKCVQRHTQDVNKKILRIRTKKRDTKLHTGGVTFCMNTKMVDAYIQKSWGRNATEC